jgi:hypothetical protein
MRRPLGSIDDELADCADAIDTVGEDWVRLVDGAWFAVPSLLDGAFAAGVLLRVQDVRAASAADCAARSTASAANSCRRLAIRSRSWSVAAAGFSAVSARIAGARSCRSSAACRMSVTTSAAACAAAARMR